MTNALNELHGRIAARQRKRARPGRSFFAEARKAANPFADYLEPLHGHELTSDNPNDESHFRAFTTALNLGLDAVHERRKGHSRFFVICPHEQWKAIQEGAK